MQDFDPFTSFGPEVAARYDAALRGDEAETVELLARLAAGRPALELAIGTGRIAIPLAATGVHIDGIEQSSAMVDVLRSKPGGSDIRVTLGDMAEVAVDGKYGLVYLVFNTLFNLITQDDQVRCFENVARHLTNDGVFLVEAGVPDPFYGLRSDQYVDAESIGVDQVQLDVGRFDRVTQTLDESHVTIGSSGIRTTPIVTRYSWPSEIDLMARIAGLRLVSRWGGWQSEPFTATSARHVSVYGR
jgi:SAM-dependent methyltransferase